MRILTRENTSKNASQSASPDGKVIGVRSARSGYKYIDKVDAVSEEFDGNSINQLTEDHRLTPVQLVPRKKTHCILI